jgi:allophanate hydrolase
MTHNSAFATTEGAGPLERPSAQADAAIAADRAHADPAMWITRLPDAAIRARARALEAEGRNDRPLWGVPFAVKDNIDVAGLATTAACPGFSYQATETAPAVQHLLDAGAILVGKTNLDQFATGLVGTRSPYGTPRNVFAADRVPGGSSSGSACAVAAGIVPFALGTDTAGSGRVPAAFGHIVGLKPTVGSISTRGMVPACRSIDTISIFARTVDEALDVQRIVARFDAQDPYSRAAPFPHWRRGAFATQGRIAAADVADLCDASTGLPFRKTAEQLNADRVEITQFLEIARLLYEGPWVAERTAALRGALAASPDILYPATRAILESGLDRLTVDAFDAFHLLAQARRHAQSLFQEYDALLLPTAPFCPTLAELDADPLGPNRRLGTFTNFANLCDLAGFAVPAGFGPDGLPVGVTILGPAWSEGRLAGIADAIHRAATDQVGATSLALPAAIEPDGPAAQETALFCIGAHMSGLPLNQQITRLGGRFLRTAATRPAYRLFDLDDRPGLLRASGGQSIVGEIWALPTASIGPLLAQVPSPLGFGTVALLDGPCLGFLAEAQGTATARDITSFQGWRAWLQAKQGSGHDR